jgi:two-component system sensor histidine kinase/response regulator
MNETSETSAPAAPSHATAPSAAFDGTRPARILVVDDQAANIQIIGVVLGQQGYEILPATDGATALKRVALRTPDLILLDLMMPGMDGCEVCRQLKSKPEWKDIPVIFLSAAADKDLIVRALDSGGLDYITKPFNHAELVSRVRTQLELKTARDWLKQLAEDKDELVGILTHDLKNYLGGINMSAELLRGHVKKFNDERLTLLTENIFRSSDLSLAFVKEFLANSAADHGLALKPVVINFVDIAGTVLKQYQEAARRKQLEIQFSSPAEAVTVLADSSALDQVLDNLISNAIKFSPAGKQLFVTVQAAGSQGECVVRDEGPGFSAEDTTRMFRRYTRLSARPTGGEPSTGLGLSIVRKLVLEMGGELACESVPGNGATFTVRLPCPASS